MPSDAEEKSEDKARGNGEWITIEFLQELLDGEEGVRVVEREVSDAVGAGDNYLSIMYQVRAVVENAKTGRREDRVFLVKGLPSAKILRDVVEDYGIFRKELYTYNVCLPAMKRIMEEYMPDEMDSFIAAGSYPCREPNVLALEDLKLSGYKMAHRRKQLDFRHTVVTLASLARFHALSVRLVKSMPEVTEVYLRDEFYSREKRHMVYPHVAKAVKSWLKVMQEDEAIRTLLPDVAKATKKSTDKMIRAVSHRDGSFTALTHGDSWTNNFMYRYDADGRVVHAKIVDFQLTRYSTPVLDLLFLFVTSTRPEVMAESFPELVAAYHKALISDMTKLRLDPDCFPSLEEIYAEIKARSISGIISMVIQTAVVVAKPSDAANFENVDAEEMEKSEDHILEKNFRDDYYKEVVFKYLKLFQEWGYLKSAEEMPVEDSNESSSPS
ncbi:UNVERIFIED_CONTAM: hypothetical protein PYX00_004088 [Menopon gallinae]|uniref:CHK kinase-like domain-containing protein n=1 Tax=Menopon gallinae TaxID=328185 RepID=A0AAW2I3Y5_9NEOP